MNTPKPSRTASLPLSLITPGYNPRRYFDRRKHEELVASMRLRGVLQPMLVRPAGNSDDAFEIVAGGRRYRAALEAFGAEGQVPVIIREMTDQEALEAAIDENDVRDDASETEQADAAVRVLAACHDDRAEAARRLGWSKAKLDRRLALANLSETVKFALDERRIKVGHAELLAAVPADKQDKALETILGSGLDVSKTRDLLMRVTQDLASACFDKTECMTCPFNSAAQRALFETHIDEGHCTNAGCFELKTQTAEMIRFEEEECAERAARASAPPASDDVADDGEDDAIDDIMADPREPSIHQIEAVTKNGASVRAVSPSARNTASPAAPTKAGVSAQSIAARTVDLREATWRTALARTLAGNPTHAHSAVLVAAMSGTLPQIKADTLKARAGLLVNAAFPDLDYRAQIKEIRTLSDEQAANVLSAIGAAYAKDASSFDHVADLARAFHVDLRAVWCVDQTFLERYTKDELKFIARECGLVAHMGEKGFAKLLGSKKPEIIAGMLNRIGFDWAGRLPSCMTLDGQYGPPPSEAARQDDAEIAKLAA
nr:PRTRC system ParB family protein [Sphingobium fuliginis]